MTGPFLFFFAKITSPFIERLFKEDFYMERFKPKKLNINDHVKMRILATITRVLITPIFLLIRIYCWIWDYDYYERFHK